MMLNIYTHKTKISNNQPVYKTYRYACFDSLLDKKMSFEEKFNAAYETLLEEINQDRRNNEMNVYSEIKIDRVFLS